LNFNGIADPAALPLLILIFGIFSTLIALLTSGYSRYIESQADRYSMELTQDPQAFIDAMTRLANQNLAVACPQRWEEILFYDHPSYNKRVEHARQFLQKGLETRFDQILYLSVTVRPNGTESTAFRVAPAIFR
jgi:STE24 endopeptidase